MKYQHLFKRPSFLILLFAFIITGVIAFYDSGRVFAWLSCLLIILFIFSVILLSSSKEEIVTQEYNDDSSNKEEPDIVFIMGPYAERWFSDPNETGAVRFDKKITWILIRTPQELAKKISIINEKHGNYNFKAIFPFLPDGHDNDSLMLLKIKDWCYLFHRNQFDIEIACSFIIYSKLGNQRSSRDPNNVFWIGDLNLNDNIKKDIYAEIELMKEQLNHICTSKKLNEIQSYTMASLLFEWIEESQLLDEIKKLLSDTPIYLTNLVISDYATGSTRHGAWSRWLQEKYAILPQLSPYISLPPLPEKVIIKKNTSYNYIIEKEKINFFIFIFPALIALAIASSLLYSFCHQVELNNHINTYISDFDKATDSDYGKKISVIKKLKLVEKKMITDSKRYSLTWGLSISNPLLAKINVSIKDFSDKPLFTSQAQAAMFDIGSSKIKPEYINNLKPLAYFMRSHPEIILLIEGHSDNSGSEEKNIILSYSRAENIKKWFILESGLPESNFAIRGIGPKEAIASNDSEEGRKMNRRVEIKIYQNDI